MRKDVYFCDVCDHPKREANHWFLVTFGSKVLFLQPWEGAGEELEKSADLHLCGAECVNKVVGKFLVGEKWK